MGLELQTKRKSLVEVTNYPLAAKQKSQNAVAPGTPTGATTLEGEKANHQLKSDVIALLAPAEAEEAVELIVGDPGPDSSVAADKLSFPQLVLSVAFCSSDFLLMMLASKHSTCP